MIGGIVSHGRIFTLLALLTTSTAGAWAGDTALLPGDATVGKQLHDTQCVACHDAKLYTRKERRVKTLGGLIAQVEICNRQLKKELSRDQTNNLVAYLNEAFYRFE